MSDFQQTVLTRKTGEWTLRYLVRSGQITDQIASRKSQRKSPQPTWRWRGRLPWCLVQTSAGAILWKTGDLFRQLVRMFISWKPAVGWYLCRRICLPSFEAAGSSRQIAAPSAVFCAPPPLARVASAACESVHRISGVSSRSSPSCGTSSSAARIATSSARVLLQTVPAGMSSLAARGTAPCRSGTVFSRGEQDASCRGGRGGPMYQTDTKSWAACLLSCVRSVLPPVL